MKRIILLLFVVALAGLFTRVSAQLTPPPPINPTIPNIWKKMTPMDTASHSAATFAVGRKIYVVMGDTTSGFFRGRLVPRTWEYDTVTKLWRRRADFPGKMRNGAVGFSIGTKGYVGGGRDFHYRDTLGKSKFKGGKDSLIAPKLYERTDTMVNYWNARGDSVMKDFWEFDTAANAWTRKADIPGTTMGRAYASSFVINGKGYVGLGYDNLSITKDLDAMTSTILGPYIDSIKHTQISAGPPPVYKIDTINRQVKIDTYDSIFVDDIKFLRDLWEYTPGTNTWAAKANFPGQPRSHATAFAMYEDAGVGLGRGDSVQDVMYKDFYSYKPSSNTWTRMTDFPASARHGAVGFGIAFLGYVVTGNDGLTRRDFYEYNNISKTWDRYPDFPDSTRFLAIGGLTGQFGYIGTGASTVASFPDFRSWFVDTNRVSITGITPAGPYCGGDSISISIKIPTGITLGSGNQFTLQVSDTAGSFFYPVSGSSVNTTTSPATFKFRIPLSTLEGTKYKFRIVSSNPVMTGTPTLTTHEIRQVPSIVGGPYLDSTCLTATSVFAVKAAGTNLTYQWRKNGNPLSNGGNISGADKDTLFINNVSAADAANYDVVVSGTCSPAVTSSQAAMVVLNIPPPTINTHPKSDTICVNTVKTFTINASGSKLNYRWIKGKDTLINNPFIIGSNTPSLTITPTRLRDSGWYKAVVFEECGARTISDSFYLKFKLETAILEQPINVDTVEFVNIGFKVKTQGVNLNYQWYKGSTKLNNGPKYSGVNTDSLTILNTLLGDVGFYQVKVWGDCGDTARSLLGLLELDASPVITKQPDSASDCAGSTVFFSVRVDGANIKYRWRKDGSFLTNGGNISGADERTLVITNIQSTDQGFYDCEVSTGPYTIIFSTPGKLTVKPIPPKPTVTNFGGGFLQSSVSGDVYRWYHNNVFEPGLTGQTVPVSKLGDYSVRVTKDGCISPLSDPLFWFPTSVGELGAAGISMYPNPAQTAIEITLPENITSANIKIYDMLGKMVVTTGFVAPGVVKVDVSKLSAGMYFVSIVTADKIYAAKLIKE